MSHLIAVIVAVGQVKSSRGLLGLIGWRPLSVELSQVELGQSGRKDYLHLRDAEEVKMHAPPPGTLLYSRKQERLVF